MSEYGPLTRTTDPNATRPSGVVSLIPFGLIVGAAPTPFDPRPRSGTRSGQPVVLARGQNRPRRVPAARRSRAEADRRGRLPPRVRIQPRPRGNRRRLRAVRPTVRLREKRAWRISVFGATGMKPSSDFNRASNPASSCSPDRTIRARHSCSMRAVASSDSRAALARRVASIASCACSRPRDAASRSAVARSSSIRRSSPSICSLDRVSSTRSRADAAC